MKRRISVALPVILDNLFDYNIEVEREIDLIGKRVLVPFGQGRKLIGVILETHQQPAEELKNAIKIIDDEAIFNPKMIKFLKWMAEYYLAPIGEVFKAATPSTQKKELNQSVKLLIKDSKSINELLGKSKKLRDLIEIISESKNEVSIMHLKKIVEGNIKAKLQKLQNLGIIELNQNESNPKSIKLSKFIRVNPELWKEVNILEEEIYKMEKKAPKRAMLLNYLIANNPENNFLKMSDITAETNINTATVKALIESEFIEEQFIEDRRINAPEFKLAHKKEIDINLTEEQTKVFNDILYKYNSKDIKPSLIYGVTGSGKTLIYMQMIKEVINRGQSAIILLPEISLTPQFIDRFELSFPDQISVIHSGMPAGEREQSYSDIRKGKTKIVIGARSALFAPAQNLGLIIVDEEHDSSFKQESPNPRYNGRDSAVMRAKIEDAAIILGSATPSVESMHNALSGKYDLHKIENRSDNAKLPKINIIDMIDAVKQGQVFNSLSRQFLNEIEKRTDKKEGIILLQNRRGFASVVQCADCGYIHQCKNCSVTLTYHKYDRLNKCHYCDYSEPARNYCINCGSVSLKIIGSGTQKIEEDISNYFADKGKKCNIERMDFDTTLRRGSHRKILERFSNGTTDVLIGTQMVAKGLDFPRVTMVGIVNSDIQLMIPDFRANERTFQLLTQVSGRAGRSGDKEGEVFIQTTMPDNPAIKSVVKSSYFDFYNDEISARKNAKYPPFSRFNVIELSSESRDLTDRHGKIFYELINKHQSLIIHPPVAPYIEKIRDNFRRIIVLKSIKSIDNTGKILNQAIKSAYRNYMEKYATAKVRIKIDIDAYSGV